MFYVTYSLYYYILFYIDFEQFWTCLCILYIDNYKLLTILQSVMSNSSEPIKVDHIPKEANQSMCK